MTKVHAGSFRDPHGSVVSLNGDILRIINTNYKNEFDHLMMSGLYDELVKNHLLVNHQEALGLATKISSQEIIYKVIRPEVVTISYPSEWTLSQLKDAALCTLQIQQIALKYNMILKDCSAYNIQFHKGRPLLIDTLSFRFFKSGEPWLAYRQFCEHFLGPLLLMAYVDRGLANLFNAYMDGIPLALVSKLLPLKRKLSPGIFLHIVLHAKSKERYKDADIHQARKSFTIEYLDELARSLSQQVGKIKWKGATNWSSYYLNDVGDDYFKAKVDIVLSLVKKTNAKRILDFGANDGTISRQMAAIGLQVIATDYDHASVERNYLLIKEQKIDSVLPLVIDATNPTPSFGWAHTERQSFSERIAVDAVLALALIHHLTIFYNVPFCKVASYFALLTSELIIEFVPKSDPMTQKLLEAKEDIYNSYTQENFEIAFCRYFTQVERFTIPHSQRIMYYFRK